MSQVLSEQEIRAALKETNHMVRNSMHGAFWPELEEACRAIESAVLAKLADKVAERDKRIAELEQQLAARVPDGWKWAPVKPTEEMIAEVGDFKVDIDLGGKQTLWIREYEEIYKRMLAAAPQPVAQPEQPAVQGEPVAWRAKHQSGDWVLREAPTLPSTGIFTGEIEPLYTHPQPERVALTSKECKAPGDMGINQRIAYRQGWSDCEAAHGIKP